MLLITGHRGQTVIALRISSIELSREEVNVDLQTLLKSNRLDDPLSSVTMSEYDKCNKLCIVRAIKAYIKLTKNIRKSDQLLISLIKPHGHISSDTLARWRVRVLALAGVNTKRSSSHSTRGALASSARSVGVSAKSILSWAG
jgi:hypothetical protein